MSSKSETRGERRRTARNPRPAVSGVPPSAPGHPQPEVGGVPASVIGSPPSVIRILLIEDNPGDARLIREMLAEARGVRVSLEMADRLASGLERLAAGEVDLVLLDLSLPDSHGLESFTTLHRQAPHVPVVILTVSQDEALGLKALQQGAQDYLVKGQLDAHLLTRTILYALERQQLHQRLRDSETRLRAIIEHNVDAMLVLDPKGVVRFANPAAGALFGQTAEDLVGAPFGFPAVAGESVEIEVPRPGGDTVVAEMRAEEIPWNGEPALLASLRDVTRRVQAQEELSKYHEHLEELVAERTLELELINELNNALIRGAHMRQALEILVQGLNGMLSIIGGALYVLDERQEFLMLQHVVFPSEIAGALRKRFNLQLPVSNIPLRPGSPYLELLQAGRPQQIQDPALLQRLLAEHNDNPGLQKLVQTIYNVWDLRAMVIVPLLSKGEAIGLLHLPRKAPLTAPQLQQLDRLTQQFAAVLEYKRTQEALRESEKKYRRLIETLQEGIWVIDKDAFTTFVNPRMAEMLGYTVDEMQGKHLSEFMDERGVEIARRTLERCQQGIKEQHDFEFLRKDGTRIYTTLGTGPITDEERNYVGAIAGVSDITARKQAEEQIVRQLQTITALYAGAQKLAESLDLKAVAQEVSRTCVEVFSARLAWLGRAEPDGRVTLLSQFPADYPYPAQITVRWDDTPEGQGPTGRAIRSGFPVVAQDLAQEPHYDPWREIALAKGFCTSAAFPLISRGRTFGTLNIYSDQPGFFTPELMDAFQALANQAAAALENARLFEEARRHAQEIEAAGQIFQSLNASPHVTEAFPAVVAGLQAITGCDRVSIALSDEKGETFTVLALDQPRAELSQGYTGCLPDSAAAADLLAGRPHLTPDLAAEADWPTEQALYQAGHRSRVNLPLMVEGWTIGALNLTWPQPSGYNEAQLPLLEQVASALALALERSRLLTAEQHQRRELDHLYQLSRQLVATDDLETVFNTVVRHLVDATHVTFCRLLTMEQDASFVCQAAHPARALDHDLGVGRPDPEAAWPLYQRALAQAEPVVLHPDDPDLGDEERQVLLLDHIRSLCLSPLRVGEEVVGLLVLGEARSPDRECFDAEKLDSIAAMADQAASAIHRAMLHRQTERRLRRLYALRAIDTAITSSLDLRLTLDVLLDQVTSQLGIHAAAVLLLNRHAQTLEYAAVRGLCSQAMRRFRLRVGEGPAGRAALERKIVAISGLESRESAIRIPHSAIEEGFVAYYGVPLIAKGQVVGVLELFHREPLDPDPEWLDFLETLAGQAAIAIDNAELFDNLHRANVELTLAYETTLEGWARALELRDYETEGHSQRVTELTVRIARAMGLSEAQLVHVRRGALLHDIGKMGVPDSILLKPGKLTDEEWEIMRQHPVYAYEMLSPITYLKPALDIPYCHHEKWDGTGYPRGLKGERIPLPARIFAVVDVWDALLSDRPYRKAWSEEKVLEHIQEQAGKHFDPAVVETFLKLMGNEGKRG